MTALGKLFRTTAFRLTLVYLTIFVLFAISLLGYFAWNTRRMITEQIVATVDADIGGLREQYQQGGIRQLVLAVESRSLRPGSSLYLVTSAQGQALAGNVGSIAPAVMAQEGWSEGLYQRLDEQGGGEHRALVRVFVLPGGFRLLVGRDLEERTRLYGIIARAARWSFAIVIVLGLAGGVFVSRRVLRRIDAMTGSTQRIMAGDLSERLPVGRSGDELDRLAANLNAMLERIEALMRGVKEVSDNIAHDLKTPLTRLRNRAEQVLASSGSEADYRAALERTIEESDALIATFNALLIIARAESGQARDGMALFDAASVARDIQELYEPLAEEKHLRLQIEADETTHVFGHRELVSQALANLVDNAIKHASAADNPALPEEGADTRNQIVISAHQDSDHIVLAVADHGPGIAQEDRERVKDRFVRLEKSRSQPGSGLGLSLVSAVATLHGGSLKMEDNKPGLRIMLLLPAK